MPGKKLSKININCALCGVLARGDIGGIEMRVLFFLLARIKFEDIIIANMLKIEEGLGLGFETVYRSIKRLVNLGILIETKNRQNRPNYKLNPQYCWVSWEDIAGGRSIKTSAV